MGFMFLFFFTENARSLKTQISPKNTKKNKYLAKNNEKKQEKTFVKGSAGAHKTRAIFQGLTLKNGMDIGV